MFDRTQPNTRITTAASVLELIYHNTVRSVRKSHANAVVAILTNMVQTIFFVAAFYVMMGFLGTRGVAIRGDYLLYIMTGVFTYMVHTRTVSAVLGSDGPASPIMKHAPMTTVVTISAAALGMLYIQILSMVTVTYIYHVAWNPITIEYWPGALGMVFLAWFAGVAVGMVLLAIKPWAPGFASTALMIYARANMVASGKMFVANSLPAHMLAWFDWNPLFHCIDQARGYTFVNYMPHNSSVTYPIYVASAVLVIGMMGEFFTRRHVSLSWSALR